VVEEEVAAEKRRSRRKRKRRRRKRPTSRYDPNEARRANVRGGIARHRDRDDGGPSRVNRAWPLARRTLCLPPHPTPPRRRSAAKGLIRLPRERAPVLAGPLFLRRAIDFIDRPDAGARDIGQQSKVPFPMLDAGPGGFITSTFTIFEKGSRRAARLLEKQDFFTLALFLRKHK
jgi:hypothetical protein